MKTQKLIIIALILVVVSCKKESDKNSRCNITTAILASTSGNQTWNLTYNEEGKLATVDIISNNPTHKDFTYDGNTVYAVTLDKDGHFKQKDSITIDEKGRPLNMRQYAAMDGSIYTNYAFVYNGDEMAKYVVTYYPSGSPFTATFTYQNGNPVSISFGSSSVILDYYSDKKIQKGDYLELTSLVEYGVGIYPHKNMVKTVASGNTISNFIYEYNSHGLVSKLTANSGTQVSVVTYAYECP